jgi:hypothetical protein
VGLKRALDPGGPKRATVVVALAEFRIERRVRSVGFLVFSGPAEIAQSDEKAELAGDKIFAADVDVEAFGAVVVGAGLDATANDGGAALETAVVFIDAKIPLRPGDADTNYP